MPNVRVVWLAALWLSLTPLAPDGCTTASAQARRLLEQVFANSLTEIPTQPLQVNGSIYVPAYSSVSISQGRARADFSVTLSIHNASQDRPLILSRIAYFDTAGK